MRAAVIAAGLWALADVAVAATVEVAALGPVGVPWTDLTAALVEVTDNRCSWDLTCDREGGKGVTLYITAWDGTAQEIAMCSLCEGATPEATAFGVRFVL